MKPFFKPDMFMENLSKQGAANVANHYLKELVDNSPVAYGNSTQFDIVSKPTSADTHKARIMFIEEIPKKECEHTRIDSIRLADIGECHECGAVMVKEWRVK